MGKNFDELLYEVFDDDEVVYLEEDLAIPAIAMKTTFKDKIQKHIKDPVSKVSDKIKDTAPGKIAKGLVKFATEAGGAGWKLEDDLRKSLGMFNEIKYKQFLDDNEKQLNNIKKKYNLEEEQFNEIVKSLISALKSNDMEKIKEEIKEQKDKLRNEKTEQKEESVIDEILTLIFSKVDQQVSKLQKEQKEVLAEIYKKYGKEIKDEILDFRKNILGPYNTIRKKSKIADKGSPYKDRLGVTKDQWKKAIKSGKNKIKNRGEFSGKLDALENSYETAKKKINDYEEVKRILTQGKELTSQQVQKLDNRFETFLKKYGSLGNALYGKYDDEDDVFGVERIRAAEVRKYYNDLQKHYKDFLSRVDNLEPEAENFHKQVEKATGDLKSYINKLTGKYSDDIQVGSSYDPNLLKALETFFFRDRIREQLRSKDMNIFKEMYLEMMKEYLEQAKNSLEAIKKTLNKNRENIEFNETEKKIWGKKKGAPELSNDLDDYYLKIKEKDFEKIDKEESEDKDNDSKDEIEDARNKIKEEMEKFKKNLKKELEDEDYKKLEDAGLFKTVKLSELVKSSEAFKDKSEIESSIQGESENENA